MELTFSFSLIVNNVITFNSITHLSEKFNFDLWNPISSSFPPRLSPARRHNNQDDAQR